MSSLPLLTTVAVAGAALGPLLNLAVDRLPRHAAVAADGTVGCEPDCRRPLAHRRAMLVALTATAFAAMAAADGLSWSLVVSLVLAACLLPLAFCDLEHLLLPKRLVWPGVAVTSAVITLAAATTGSGHRAEVAALCALGATAVLGLLWFVNPGGLGFGDVRLGLLLGLALGWVGVGVTLVAFLLASLASGLCGATLLVSGRAGWGQGKALPFGVFLAGGSLVALTLPLLFR